MADATAELEILVQIKAAIANLDTLKLEAKKAAAAAKEVSGGFQNFADGASKAFGQLKVAAAAALGVIAGRAVVNFLEESVTAAAASEAAFATLGKQLELTGEGGAAALAGMQGFASEMQNTTKYGDDLVISQLAVAKSFGISNSEAKSLVKAAAELAAATGQSLDSAVQALGKSLSGVTGKLDRKSVV